VRLERAIIEAVDDRADAAIAILRSLVQSPSPSLAEGLATDAASMVGKVHAAAASHGTAVEVQNVAPDSDNVIEQLGPRGNRTFVIEAHTDAVPEGDRARWLNGDPFSGAEG